METKELVCVNCPLGCVITVEKEGTEVLSIKGNTCARGETYARQECLMPMRILTSTVKIENGLHRVLPVVTSAEIPLERMEEAMNVIRAVTVNAPVDMGQIIIENLLGTEVNVIASRSMKTKS